MNQLVDEKYLIGQEATLLEALNRINDLKTGPLVLFVMDEQGKIVGSLTDGDVRRALIAGAAVSDRVYGIMHRSFNYLCAGEKEPVKKLRVLKQKNLKLVPILDEDGHISEIVNLDSFITRLPIDAVLMAGGKGERLRPLTEKTPKPLLKVGEKSIIDHNIDRLISYGVDHISVTVNYLAEQIEEHFREPRTGVPVQCVREPKYLGTLGSIKYVRNFFHDTILVMNSDLFTNINYEDFYLHFKEHDAEMSVAAVPYTISVPYGVFDLDGRNIKGLVEKPSYNYYANAGIYLIKRSAMDEIPEDTFFNATDLIVRLIAKDRKVIRFPLNGTWIDIGNPQEYQKAKDLVKYIDF